MRRIDCSQSNFTPDLIIVGSRPTLSILENHEVFITSLSCILDFIEIRIRDTLRAMLAHQLIC